MFADFDPLFFGIARKDALAMDPQGCSTLLEVFYIVEGFDASESCGVSILGDGVGLIEAENIIGEAA
jgi:hypothetical protein